MDGVHSPETDVLYELTYRGQRLRVNRYFANQKPIYFETVPSLQEFTACPFPLPQLTRQGRMNLRVTNSGAIYEIVLLETLLQKRLSRFPNIPLREGGRINVEH